MYYLFGSENSRDYDVVVIVDSLEKTIDDNHSICKSHNDILSKIYTDKPLNCNIATIYDGYITSCFKGTVDELNNVLIYTYHLHNQQYPLLLNGLVERDKHEKIKRVVRGLLSYYSRSNYRSDIKQALRSDLIKRLEVLSKIDLSIYYDFKDKKEVYQDILKVFAFQYGQLFSLYDGYEADSYTKNGIIKNYTDLEPFINRRSEIDLLVLEKYKKRLIELAIFEIQNMQNLYEKIK
jgi:hypothetical protein